ncbi:hypothetical protein MYCTH_104959 [Thermothelomyces thermophilus ATCC 42464]|uniref:Uncharacterized protein n=1 Tax=Thermothelomyces thermophilus (strain ATCC 42464 / BCRC 31852 / DSM 1799) TaxID=573729 RepID=G2Q3U1_THET4|nr:uncharacterized protein MYCTH_104959 [Thermothelomyces thermophilus ATCC 42464]AEO55244.1 hypothetical protein MYCTH_104959 [Thermothelomyces thermophilus ATCC 42464]
MPERYSAEFLLHLRQSPLCVKPPNLPPPEEWMGPPPETFRNQQKASNDRTKSGEGGVPPNQENRRPPHDRNGSRNAANPEDLILGPPRTSFASASATSMRGSRTGDAEKGFRDSDRHDRNDRFNFRNRVNDSDNPSDRFGRDARDGRNAGFRRRPDQDQDSEGWSTVKPRKSFGHDGAERFHGRMGGVGNDRFGARDDARRARDRDDRDAGGRGNRNFEHRSRDQDGDEADTPRRNGLGRGKSESWFRDNTAGSTSDAPPMTQRERIERAKSWRDRDPEDKPHDRFSDRNDRNLDRKWDRDRHARVENDPEWLDEPAETKTQGHTEEDFKKFMESMKAGRTGGGAPKQEEKPSAPPDQPPATTAVETENKVASAPAVEPGPDKFFAAYGSSGLDVGTPIAEVKDAIKPKTAKPSRFMAFLAPQDDSRAKTEPATPAAAGQSGEKAASSQQSDADKEAFALLIQKLQRSGLGSSLQGSAPPAQTTTTTTTAAPGMFPEPSPFQELQQKSAVTSPEPFQQYGNSGRRDDPRARTSQHSLHDMISPRPTGLPMPPPPATRPEQALQELLAQRHQLPSQPSTRAESQNASAINRNREFLVGLMQGHREVPEPARPEQLLRMPQPTKQVSLANVPDREQDYSRERSASQRQQMRGGPPGFLDDGQFHPGDVDSRPPPQPTQILQRPPPPGLDHQMHPFHMGGVNPAVSAAAAAGQMPPQRPMIPPPGLMNNGPRNIPMPGMFPPNFPPPHGHSGPGNFPPGPPPPHAGGPPPPDGMVGPPPGPPRSMQPPPGFFGGPPPPGFMPPPGMGGGSGFQGPDGPQPPNAGPGPGPGPGPNHGGMAGFGGMPSPFERLERMAGMDRRGMMPPPGGYRGP